VLAGKWVGTYGMLTVGDAFEMDHTIQAGIGCLVALVTVRIEFLLGEDVAAALDDGSGKSS
jgi:hypothetical protein